MNKIKKGQIYVRKGAPERMIKILTVKRGSKVQVKYVSATEKTNIGLVATLYKISIARMYVLMAPIWEV